MNSSYENILKYANFLHQRWSKSMWTCSPSPERVWYISVLIKSFIDYNIFSSVLVWKNCLRFFESSLDRITNLIFVFLLFFFLDWSEKQAPGMFLCVDTLTLKLELYIWFFEIQICIVLKRFHEWIEEIFILHVL